MFGSNQIISASQFIRKFRYVTGYLTQYPLPILVTQKNGEHFVFLKVEIYEKIMEENNLTAGVTPLNFTLREQLNCPGT